MENNPGLEMIALTARGDNMVDTVENMTRLKELDKQLSAPPLESIAHFFSRHAVLYDATEGSNVPGEALFNDGTAAVMYCEMKARTTLSPHFHNISIERVIIISGQFHVKTANREYTVTDGQEAVFLPHEEHVVDTPVDTRMICVTIPASPGYPK